MTRINIKLDAELRKEKHLRFRYASIFSVIFVLLVMMSIAYSTGETKTIMGTVTHFRSKASENSGEHFYIHVLLNSNKKISIEIPRETAVKIGDSVNIVEMDTNFFNLERYTFQMVSRAN